MKKLKHYEITQEIIKCAMSVHSGLGPGYYEKVYETALMYELQDADLLVETQKELPVIYKKRLIGNFYADLLVENKIIVELKATSGLTKSHKQQIINYLKTTGYEVGLLLDFGTDSLQIKRVINT